MVFEIPMPNRLLTKNRFALYQPHTTWSAISRVENGKKGFVTVVMMPKFEKWLHKNAYRKFDCPVRTVTVFRLPN